jgi:hypothetical protein
MKIHAISLKNYRLISSADIQLVTGNNATVFIGPNNSGKTSVAEALFSFLSGSVKSFAISDFSVRTHVAFQAFERTAVADTAELNAAVPPPELPFMRLDLHLRYDDTPEDLIVADLLLMDFDETSSEVTFRIELRPVLTGELAAAFKSIYVKDQKWTLREFLASRLNPQGEALYLFAHDEKGLEDSQTYLRATRGWSLDSAETKQLFLTHRLIARKAGYIDLIQVYGDRGGVFSLNHAPRGAFL